MNIILASDHGGFELKKHIKKFLKNNKKKLNILKLIDNGIFMDKRCDYPDIIENFYPEYINLSSNKLIDTYGIVLCGTGIGVSIVCNKLSNIRCALCHNKYTAEMARKHNNANILALGGRILKKKQAIAIVKTFIQTKFEGGRHFGRVNKISIIKEKYNHILNY